MKEPCIKCSVNVDVAKRKFNPNLNGKETAPDGTKGNYGPWSHQQIHNLLCNAGRDFLHEQGYETSGLGTNGGNYIALTSNTAAANAADTTLTGEIAAGGLNRTQGAVAHTTGQTTSTVSNTFTASTTHTNVQKSGLFTASSSGTMVHEATFTPVTLENQDQLMVTWTVTLS